MRILCVADHVDPIVYSSSVKKRFGDVAFVLGAGDLNLEYYGFIVSSLNRPLYFVFGNHNLKYLRYYRKPYPGASMVNEDLYEIKRFGSVHIDGKVVRERNVLIAGLGGSRRYNREENQYTEFQMYRKIFRLLPSLLWNKLKYGRYLDLLLTHSPPRGINDRDDQCHTGFKAFLSFIKWFRPRYLVHGHIHLYTINEPREAVFQSTRIINAYDHIVLEFDNIPGKEKCNEKD